MARYEVRSELVRYRVAGESEAFRLAQRRAGDLSSSAGERLSACLYRPLLPNPQPGLLLIQEGWDNQARGMAERLAHVGYVTLAVDAYPGELESPPAGAQASARAESNMRAAVAWLRARPFVKDGIAGSIGFGQGGGLALLLATSADPVQAAVSIDGDTDALADRVAGARAPLLVIGAGAARQHLPEDAGVLRAALSASGLPHEFVRYPLAARSFCDERQSVFRPDDAEDAWSRANKFFYKHLGEPG